MKKLLPLIGSMSLLLGLVACDTTTSSTLPDINDFNEEVTLSEGLEAISLAYENVLDANTIKIGADLTNVSTDTTTVTQVLVDGVLQQTTTTSSKQNLTSSIDFALNIDDTKTVDQAFKGIVSVGDTNMTGSATIDDVNLEFGFNFESVSAYLDGSKVYLDVTNTGIYDQILEIVNTANGGSTSQTEQLEAIFDQIGEKIAFDLSSLNNSTSLPVLGDFFNSLPSADEIVTSVEQILTTLPVLSDLLTFKTNGEDTLVNINVTNDDLFELVAFILSSSDPNVPPMTAEEVEEMVGDSFNINSFDINIVIDSVGYISYLDTDIDMKTTSSSNSNINPGDDTAVATNTTVTSNVVFDTTFTFDFSEETLELPSDLDSYYLVPISQSGDVGTI